MPSLKFPDFSRIDWRDWKTYFALPIVLIIFALWKPLESLRSAVWRRSGGFGGSWHEVLALTAASGAAVSVQQTTVLPFSIWLGQIGEAIGVGFLTWAYAFPIVWLLFLRPAYRCLKYCIEHFDFVDTNITGPLMQLSPKVLMFAPGARRGWEQLKDDNWFIIVLGIIAYATGLLSSLYFGWQAQKFFLGFLPVNFWTAQFALGLSWAAAMIVAGLLARIICGALSEARNYGLGTLLGGVLTYACSSWLSSLSLDLGAPIWITMLVFYALAVTYCLPILYIICASGFWKRMWKRIEPLYISFFQGKETAFRHIALQSLAIGLTFLIGATALWSCALMGLNPFVSLVATVLLLSGAYAILPEVIDQVYGNFLASIIGAISAGSFGGVLYCRFDYLFSVYGGIAAGVVVTLLSFVVIPLVYKACEWLVTLAVLSRATNWLGKLLPKVHEQYMQRIVEPFVDACKSIYNDGYGRSFAGDAKKLSDFAEFRKLTLHVTSASLAAILSYWAYVGLNLIAFLDAFEPVIAGVLTALVAVFSLGLLSRGFLKAGLEWPGLVVSLLTGLYTAMLFMSATAFGAWVAVPTGVIAAVLTFGMVFPGCMIALRAMLTWAAPTLNGPLDWTADKAWMAVRGFWRGFCKLFDFIYDLFEPIWHWLSLGFAWMGRQLLWITAPIWIACGVLWSSCHSIWKGIFGGR